MIYGLGIDKTAGGKWNPPSVDGVGGAPRVRAGVFGIIEHYDIFFAEPTTKTIRLLGEDDDHYFKKKDFTKAEFQDFADFFLLFFRTSVQPSKLANNQVNVTRKGYPRVSPSGRWKIDIIDRGRMNPLITLSETGESEEFSVFDAAWAESLCTCLEKALQVIEEASAELAKAWR